MNFEHQNKDAYEIGVAIKLVTKTTIRSLSGDRSNFFVEIIFLKPIFALYRKII